MKKNVNSIAASVAPSSPAAFADVAGASIPMHARPLVTVDVVIWTVLPRPHATGFELQVLLVRRPALEGEPFPHAWALPGGFVNINQDESLLACAVRKLQDKTGLQTHHLEQLGSWGNAHRDPRGWSATHVYMALIPAPEAVDASAQWHTLAQVADTPLAFDHRELLDAALSRLRSKVEYTSLPAFLLPEPFTLPQLQQVYEAVLGRELDKSAFRKRMLDSDFLQESGPIEGTGPRKPMSYHIRNRTHPTIFPRTFRASEGGG